MIVFFVYNILIFNYKDTKNYRDYQLFKRISYPELRFKKLQEKNDTLTEMLRLKTETCEALQLSKHCLELLVAKNVKLQ